jgi:hypothetical protein
VRSDSDFASLSRRRLSWAFARQTLKRSLLEDGEPKLESEFVGVQTIQVA